MLLRLIPLILLITLLKANDLSLKLTPPTTVMENLKAGQVPQKQRQSTIESLFQQAGCQTTLEKIDHHNSNVICTLPGETPDIILVGGHYDFVEKGAGIVDDWSGTAMLVSLYQTLKETRQKHTYQFIAFGGEEVGLAGSFRFVKDITPDQKIVAFINLECLGMDPPGVWASRANPRLLQLLTQIANAAKIPIRSVNIEKFGDDDSHAFLNHQIPVLTIHSVDQETISTLHSNLDDLRAVNAKHYYTAYILAAFYLQYLDQKL